MEHSENKGVFNESHSFQRIVSCSYAGGRSANFLNVAKNVGGMPVNHVQFISQIVQQNLFRYPRDGQQRAPAKPARGER
jgi:hypothetical protein